MISCDAAHRKLLAVAHAAVVALAVVLVCVAQMTARTASLHHPCHATRGYMRHTSHVPLPPLPQFQSCGPFWLSRRPDGSLTVCHPNGAASTYAREQCQRGGARCANRYCESSSIFLAKRGSPAYAGSAGWLFRAQFGQWCPIFRLHLLCAWFGAWCRTCAHPGSTGMGAAIH